MYSRYGTAVYSMARYMLPNEALAEEATQEVFLNIWLKASSYNAERGQPKAWVMSVAHHKIVDIIRSRRRNITMAHPTDYETLETLPSSQRATDEQVTTNLEGQRIPSSPGANIPVRVGKLDYDRGQRLRCRQQNHGTP